ncbi:hypothetical protein [Cohnella sp. AR92]|uniref:hypothetical protein n=1 Tax=Cohnella sp. AR92 TaxID=648716 RepID=UPI000F8EDC97|nr:hypothetical protein [Cohnella sp. AR92]RUS44902.1 hypothetical protein ELR57_21840 [Cohnella sp. AR92]
MFMTACRISGKSIWTQLIKALNCAWLNVSRQKGAREPFHDEYERTELTHEEMEEIQYELWLKDLEKERAEMAKYADDDTFEDLMLDYLS